MQEADLNIKDAVVGTHDTPELFVDGYAMPELCENINALAVRLKNEQVLKQELDAKHVTRKSFRLVKGGCRKDGTTSSGHFLLAKCAVWVWQQWMSPDNENLELLRQCRNILISVRNTVTERDQRFILLHVCLAFEIHEQPHLALAGREAVFDAEDFWFFQTLVYWHQSRVDGIGRPRDSKSVYGNANDYFFTLQYAYAFGKTMETAKHRFVTFR